MKTGKMNDGRFGPGPPQEVEKIPGDEAVKFAHYNLSLRSSVTKANSRKLTKPESF